MRTFEEILEDFEKALADVREMEEKMEELGSDWIYFYIEDVEGDWLELWD